MKTDGSNAKAVQKAQQGAPSLKQWVMKNADQIKNALPKGISQERMVRVALTALTQNKRLMQCTPASFMGAVLTSAQLGLECNTPQGYAYIIPYQEHGEMLAHFQLGYKGIIALCQRTKQYKRIEARVVYEGDTFEYSYGFDEKLFHKPCGRTDKPTHVYALYELFNGGRSFEVMSWDAVMAHAKKYSQAARGSTSPWQTDPESMAKKTVVKRVLKYAPMTVEADEIISSDNAVVKIRKESEGGDEWLAKDIELPTDEAEDVPLDAQDLAKDAAKADASVDDGALEGATGLEF